MRGKICKFVALMIAAVMLLSLCGCVRSADLDKQGITISDERAYSSQTVEYARGVVRSLILCYYESTSTAKLPEPMLARIEGVADDMVDLLSQDPVEEALFLELMERLERRGSAVIGEICDFRAGKEGSLAKTKELYLELTAALGADYIAGILYVLSVYFYDFGYADKVEKYEKYGYPHYEIEAKALLEERRILVNEIGRGNFATFLGCFLALSELFFGGALEDGHGGTFTDEEILLFLKSSGLSELSLSVDAWTLILSKILPQEGTDAYFSKLSAQMRENGDAELLGVAAFHMASLLPALERLTADDVARIRMGDRSFALRSVFRGLNESEWAHVAHLGELSFHNDEYHVLAAEAHGEAYVAYLESLAPVTYEELRASISEEDFYGRLVNYVVGICPALFYAPPLAGA